MRISVLLLLLLAITSAGWGQIAQRGTATSATSNSPTLTIDKPAGLVSGDVMIVNITKTNSYNVDASGAGWILLAGDQLGAGNRRTTILYRVADGTEGPSFQFSLGEETTSSVGSIIAFSGVDASVFDVNPGSLQVGAGNSIPVTGITTNTDNAAVLFLAGAGGTQQGAYSNWNVTSPVLTEIMDFIYSNNIHNSVGAAWGILSTAGNTGNGTVSLLSSQYHGGMLIALKPAFQPGSQPVSFVNYGVAEQVVFDNAYLHFDIPVFRVHSEVAVSRIYIEVSESSDFTQMISFQEFKQGLGANTSSNYACNLFTPALEFKANKTYYARVRGWVGGQWSPWSEPISFTFKSQSVDLPEWHQTTNAQFESNSLTRLFAQNNTLGVMEQITINKGIFNGRDDAYSYNTTNYYTREYLQFGSNRIGGFRFRDLQIPQDAEIISAKLFLNAYGGQSNTVNLGIFLEKVANPPDFSSSGPHLRNTVTPKVNWDHNQNWSDEIYYSTPELKGIVQEVVNLPVWNPGNPMSVIIRYDWGSNYRIVSSFEESPDLAARFIVKYKNDAGGNVLSTPIALASIKDAASWKKLFWSELGTLGDFRVSVQTSNDGVTWTTSLSDLNYDPSGHDLSSLGSSDYIRLIGAFSGNAGNTPFLVDWTVSCNDDSGQSDLSLSLAGNNLSGCDGAENQWRLLVSNNGPNQATDINIKVNVPTGMSFVSGEPGTGFFDPSGQQWIITALDVAESVYLDFITLTASSASSLLVQANIKSLNQDDPEPSNNETEYSLILSSNNAPEISTIPDVVTAFNTTSSAQTFTISDAETPAGNLILTSFSDNTDLIPNENIQLGGSGGTRTVSFTPGANQFGSCEITILVSDGECFSTQIFTATVLRHTVANWVAADIVIGQTNFSNQSTAFTNYTTPGAVSSSVSAKGVLAVGGQRNGSTYVGRVMLWNTVPETNGVAANIVVGKNGFNDNTPGCSKNRMRMAEDVAFSPDGEKLIVADGGDGGNNRVLIWNSIPITSGANANVVIGQTDFNNYSSGTGSNKFNRPVGLLVTPDGRLLVTDFYNHRVLIFNQIPTTNNASADVVIGQPDMFTNTPGITADKFHGPWTTALTADGKLLVSDCYNSRVLIFNKIPEENGVAADLVIGQEDVNISGYNLNGLDEFSVGEPAVSLSPTGMVAVGDFLNHRVTLYNEVPGNNGVQANVVLGQPDFNQGVVFNNGSGITESPSAYNMRNVYTIRYDLNDRLFVSGRDMHRVMVFGLPPTQVAELAIDLKSLNQEVGGVCYDAETGFRVEVTNKGPETATNVVVKTAFPFGFPFTEYIADKGTYQFQGGEWFIPTIANGKTVTLSFFGFVPSTTANKDYTVYAAIRSSNQRDTDFSNNAESLTFHVKEFAAAKVGNIPDLSAARDEATTPFVFPIEHENVNNLVVAIESSNTSIVPVGNIVVDLSDPAGVNGSVTINAPPGNRPGYSDITLTFFAPDGTSCPTVREFRVYFGNLWLGHTTDWGVPFNWSRQVVPGISPPFDEAYIPTIPEGGHFPLVPQNYKVNYVEMETETSISVAQNRTLSILEDLNFQGNAIISGDGAIVAKNVNIPSGLINITTPTALLKVESNLDLGSASSEGIIRTPGFIQIGESGKDAFITHNAGRIIGEIRHWINAGLIANKDIHLPLGTEDDNRWVVMKFVSPPSSNGFIQIWVQMDNPFSADPDLGIPCEAIGEKVSVLLGGSFWRITPLNNAFSEGGYSYDVQFYTEGMNGLASYLPTELKMIKRTINPDSGWFLPGYPKEPISVDPLNNTYWLIRSEVETFSFFTVGKDDIPLPIELLSFSATYRDPDVLLEWATGSEINNDYFTIERSPDVEQAEIIGYVDGAGNSSQTLWYGFVDQNPLPGISYYRLKQTDFDGKFEYFDWVAVDAGLAGGDGLKVVVETHLQGHTLRIFSPGRKRLQVEVTDLLGQKVISQELNPSDIGQVDVFIPETLSRQGVLIYRVTDGIEVVSGKIVR